MKRTIAIVALVVPAMSCSSSPTTPDAAAAAPAPPPPVAASGENWSLRSAGNERVVVTNGASTSRLAALKGALDVTGATPSAVMAVYGRCFNASYAPTHVAWFGGTYTGTTVELVSQPVNGHVIRFSGRVSPDGSAFEGSYSVQGACAGGARGSLTGRRIQLDGTWMADSLILALTQRPQPRDDGRFLFSGTADVLAATECFPAAALEGRLIGRVLFPDTLSGDRRLELVAEVTEDQSAMLATSYGLAAGTCPSAGCQCGVAWTLVRQESRP